MMEPKEYKSEEGQEKNYLIFVCKMCQHTLKAKDRDTMDNCVFLIDFTERTMKSDVDPECIDDPTLMRRTDVICPHCRHQEAVCYSETAKDRIRLIFVCRGCRKHWLKNEGENDDEEYFSEDDEAKN
jgi:predicted metal-binding protein